MTVLDSLRALADPTRLRIMRLLASMELAVGELAQVLEQSQPRVSRHVKILCDAGLAERRREGGWVFLRAALGEGGGSTLLPALANLLGQAEGADPGFGSQCDEDRQHLDAIRTARDANAAEYFARHAEEWDSLRSMHIADGPVEAALAEMLGQGAKGGLGRLLDVGTGTGRMAELFAPSSSHVTALDKSPDMLRLARTRLQHLPAGQVTLVQGDFAQLPFAAASFDTVLFHQVMHYALAPEAVLAEAAQWALDQLAKVRPFP
jgi:ArsR family transcriptional regulator